MNKLNLQNISVQYNDNVLIEDFSFSFNNSGIVAIIGKNGSGKSSLLKAIVGIKKLSSGDISIKGKSLKNYSYNGLAKEITAVFTKNTLPLNCSVLEFVSYGRTPYLSIFDNKSQLDLAKIDDAILIMQINHLRQNDVNSLSDGQLQKAIIARALAQDTDILLLDEPTTFLDFEGKKNLFETLEKISKTKLIIISTHDILLAKQHIKTFLSIENKKIKTVQNLEKLF